MASLHISIAPEEITKIGTFSFTNSMLGSSLVILLLLLMGIILKYSVRKYGMPSKPQLFMESAYQLLEGITKQTIGEARTRKYLGLVIILFLYIVLGSWLGLLPGILHLGFEEMKNGASVFVPLLRAPTTDLNATTALALIAFTTIQYAGISELGLGKYFGKFFNFSNAGSLMLGMLELVFEFVRILSFSFRLFGNIFAGEVLLGVIGLLSTITFAKGQEFGYIQLPFPALVIVMEFFVALIQAYVFVNLMTVFISVAAEPPHHDKRHEELREELA